MKKIWLCDAIKIFLFCLLFLLFGIAICYLSSRLVYADAISASVDASEYTFILDAGHGGEDAGAIGINGVYEKDINLNICNILSEILKTNGFNVILTRTEDRLLYTEEENIKGYRKYYDLKNRLKVAEENPNAIFISVHMNNFSQENCRGMQVYYPTGDEESRLLAIEIQNMVKNTLQDYNTRQVKESDGNIYLLEHANGTAVLIECGFLSNREECEKLSSKDYQTQLSFQIFCGIMEYIKNKGNLAMKTSKNIFVCAECGFTNAKWLGKCPDCGAWNSFEEQEQIIEKGESKKTAKAANYAEKLSQLEMAEYIRMKTGLGELDRVLGGGLVKGSVVLISGEPGIGKSTLLLQICNKLASGHRVLYVSGEESLGQIKLRAERLKINEGELYLLAETSVDSVISEYERIKPDVLMVDSIQTMYSEKFTSFSGSISQVRECAMTFIELAKRSSCSVFLVGHVNKEGGISGPKILEHMVDAVLYFEGERRQSYRIIRAIKNRYGSTNEIGVFEMSDIGLIEVPNPSEMMLEGRVESIGGNCAGCVMEGSRPIITEIQSLVAPTVFPSPKRTSDGFDYNRMCLLLAVLERRLGLKFSQNDVYINIAGGMRLDEPAADLSVAMSLVSAVTDRIAPNHLIAFGEIGLSGEIRSVSHVEYRVKESVRLGFKTIVLPKKNVNSRIKVPEGVTLAGVSSIYETLKYLHKKEEV